MGSEAHEHVPLLHAGVERLPEHEGVKPCPQLLGHRHDNVQVPLGLQVQVRLEVPEGPERLLPFLPVNRGQLGLISLIHIQ